MKSNVSGSTRLSAGAPSDAFADTGPFNYQAGFGKERFALKRGVAGASAAVWVTLVIVFANWDVTMVQARGLLNDLPMVCVGAYGFTPIKTEKAYRSVNGTANDRSLTVFTDSYSMDVAIDQPINNSSTAQVSQLRIPRLGIVLKYTLSRQTSFGGQPWEGPIALVVPKHVEYVLPASSGLPAVRVQILNGGKNTVSSLLRRFVLRRQDARCFSERIVR